MNDAKQITVNPAEAAAAAWEFLRKTPITGDDVDRLTLVRSFLHAIASGQVVVTPAADASVIPGAAKSPNGAAHDSPPAG